MHGMNRMPSAGRTSLREVACRDRRHCVCSCSELAAPRVAPGRLVRPEREIVALAARRRVPLPSGVRIRLSGFLP
jgi:hypothetical protein